MTGNHDAHSSKPANPKSEPASGAKRAQLLQEAELGQLEAAGVPLRKRVKRPTKDTSRRRLISAERLGTMILDGVQLQPLSAFVSEADQAPVGPGSAAQATAASVPASPKNTPHHRELQGDSQVLAARPRTALHRLPRSTDRPTAAEATASVATRKHAARVEELAAATVDNGSQPEPSAQPSKRSSSGGGARNRGGSAGGAPRPGRQLARAPSRPAAAVAAADPSVAGVLPPPKDADSTASQHRPSATANEDHAVMLEAEDDLGQLHTQAPGPRRLSELQVGGQNLAELFHNLRRTESMAAGDASARRGRSAASAHGPAVGDGCAADNRGVGSSTVATSPKRGSLTRAQRLSRSSTSEPEETCSRSATQV